MEAIDPEVVEFTRTMYRTLILVHGVAIIFLFEKVFKKEGDRLDRILLKIGQIVGWGMVLSCIIHGVLNFLCCLFLGHPIGDF